MDIFATSYENIGVKNPVKISSKRGLVSYKKGSAPRKAPSLSSLLCLIVGQAMQKVRHKQRVASELHISLRTLQCHWAHCAGWANWRHYWIHWHPWVRRCIVDTPSARRLHLKRVTALKNTLYEWHTHCMLLRCCIDSSLTGRKLAY